MKLSDSTNEEAKRLARKGERGPLWITALRQTAGRGRHGREWVSKDGNLFATLLMAVAQRNSSQIAFIAGIASADLCARYVPRETVKLKWPNDVLIGGRKAAGVLVEQATDRLVAGAGIGIDLAHCPAGIGAVSIAGIAGFAPASRRGPCCARAWHERMAYIVAALVLIQYAKRGSIAPAESENPFVRLLRRPVLTEIFESLDNDGALLLRDGAGASHRITAADVFYGG